MALNQLGLGMLFTATDLASGVMKKLESQFSQTRNELGQFQTQNKDLFKQFGVGVAAMGAGMVTMAGFAPAIAAATEFEHSIANIRTVIDEASLSTDKARETTMALAATYGSDAISQANALYETISSGVTDAAEATKLLEVANRFAVGGNTQMESSIDVLTSAVNVYRDSGLTAAEASDIMFTAIAAGKTTAQQLSQYLGEVAPTAQAAGVGFDELNAAIAALTVQGIRTPQAVTGLNAMLSNLMKPSSDAADEAKRLGIEFNATALKTMGLKGVLSQLIGNSKLTDDSMGKLFGSIDGIKAALALTSGGGAKFDEVLAQMGGSAGATDKAFGILSNTTKFQASRFLALGKNALLLIGDAIQPLTTAILSFANTVLEKFGQLPGPFLTVAARGIFVAGALTTLVGALTAVKAAAGLAGPALKMFAIEGAGSVLAALGPALLVVAAGAAVFYAFKYAAENNIGGLADTLSEKFGGIKLAFQALSQLFTDGGFSGNVREEFLRGGNPAIEFATKVYVVVNRIQGFLQGLGEGFGAVMERAGPSIEQLVMAFEKLGNALGVTSNDAQGNKEAFGEMISTGQQVGEVIGGVAVFIIDTITAVVSFAAGIARVWDRMSEPFGRLWDSIGQVFGAVGQLISAVTGMGGATDGASADWVTMGERIGGVLAGVAGFIGAVFSGLAGIISGAADMVRGFITMMAGLLSGDGAQAWAGFKQIAFGALSAIMESLGGLVEAVASAIDSLGALAGKDLGFGKKINQFRADVRAEAEGLRPAGTVSGPSPAVSIGPPPPPTAPAGVASTVTPTSDGLGAINASLDRLSAAQAKPQPAPITNVRVMIDGADIPGRTEVDSFGPTAPAG